MLVKLARSWFGPDGALHHVRNNPHSFPDDWKGDLPKGAKVLSKAEEKTADKADAVAKEKTPEQQKLTGSS